MIQIYRKLMTDDHLFTQKEITVGSWIHLTAPTEQEICEVSKKLDVEPDFFIRILDDEEQPRVDTEENQQLIIIDVPKRYMRHGQSQVKTYPLGILLLRDQYVVTISNKKFEFMQLFQEDKVKEFYTDHKSRFVIQILYQVATYYLKGLKLINQDIEATEDLMFTSTSNRDLAKMLSLEKALVYFSTSLRENAVVLEKISKGNVIPLFPEDADLFDDAIIENSQGIEMANLYREILSSMTDSFATVISNNLNGVMKFLTGITIVISIPTMVASFLGMNVPLGSFQSNPFSFWILICISILVSLIVAFVLRKKNML